MVSGVPVHRIEVHSRSGKVVHRAANLRSSVLISVAPLLIGGILSFFLFSYAKEIVDTNLVWAALATWLGFSIAFHSIPSHPDMVNISEAISRRLGELWASPRGIGTKIVKSVWYVLVWPFAIIGSLAVWAVDLTLFARMGWALLVGWAA
jgi:hypothetical protein